MKKFTEDEKKIEKNIDKEYKWISRNSYGNIYVHKKKPIKSDTCWNVSITPRKETDRGGVVMMPLLRNVPEGNEGWKLTTCPNCGAKCWTSELTQFVVEHQGATAMGRMELSIWTDQKCAGIFVRSFRIPKRGRSSCERYPTRGPEADGSMSRS